MNQYKPELGRFYSDSNPEVWVFQAERYFNFYGFSEDSWLSMPYVYFKGEARAWFDWLYRNDQFRDWNHFKEKLVMHYQNRTFANSMEKPKLRPTIAEQGSEILRQLAELRDALSACATKLLVNSTDQRGSVLPVEAEEVVASKIDSHRDKVVSIGDIGTTETTLKTQTEEEENFLNTAASLFENFPQRSLVAAQVNLDCYVLTMLDNSTTRFQTLPEVKVDLDVGNKEADACDKAIETAKIPAFTLDFLNDGGLVSKLEVENLWDTALRQRCYSLGDNYAGRKPVDPFPLNQDYVNIQCTLFVSTIELASISFARMRGPDLEVQLSSRHLQLANLFFVLKDSGFAHGAPSFDIFNKIKVGACDFVMGLHQQLDDSMLPLSCPDYILFESWNPLTMVGLVTAFHLNYVVIGWTTYISMVFNTYCVWEGNPTSPFVTITKRKIVASLLMPSTSPRSLFASALCVSAAIDVATNNDTKACMAVIVTRTVVFFFLITSCNVCPAILLADSKEVLGKLTCHFATIFSNPCFLAHFSFDPGKNLLIANSCTPPFFLTDENPGINSKTMTVKVHTEFATSNSSSRTKVWDPGLLLATKEVVNAFSLVNAFHGAGTFRTYSLYLGGIHLSRTSDGLYTATSYVFDALLDTCEKLSQTTFSYLKEFPNIVHLMLKTLRSGNVTSINLGLFGSVATFALEVIELRNYEAHFDLNKFGVLGLVDTVGWYVDEHKINDFSGQNGFYLIGLPELFNQVFAGNIYLLDSSVNKRAVGVELSIIPRDYLLPNGVLLIISHASIFVWIGQSVFSTFTDMLSMLHSYVVVIRVRGCWKILQSTPLVLARAFRLVGELVLVPDYCKAFLRFLEKLYGPNHIVVGPEFVKLAFLQMLAIQDIKRKVTFYPVESAKVLLFVTVRDPHMFAHSFLKEVAEIDNSSQASFVQMLLSENVSIILFHYDRNVNDWWELQGSEVDFLLLSTHAKVLTWYNQSTDSNEKQSAFAIRRGFLEFATYVEGISYVVSLYQVIKGNEPCFTTIFSNLEDKVLIEDGSNVMNYLIGLGNGLGNNLRRSPSTKQPNKRLIWDPGPISNWLKGQGISNYRLSKKCENALGKSVSSHLRFF